MDHFDGMLHAWTKALSAVEKRALGDVGTGIFLTFRQVRVEEEFIDACLDFWDPAYNVFRFMGGEMCPLVEEFEAIAGWGRMPLPVVLRLELGYKARVRDLLMLSKSDVDFIFVGDKISMVRLVSKFANRNDLTIAPAARRRALSFCLLQRYGFTSMLGESLLGDPRILVVVEQMEMGRSPAPLILAETILGLNDRFHNRGWEYRGCPRMMQVWLMERMGVLAPVDDSYKANALTSRALSWMGARYRPAGYFVDFVRARPLRWVVPWWRIRNFSGNSALGASAGIMLCGFSFAVWIHPLRVLRQMGLAQVIPREDTQIQVPIALTDAMIETWAVRWGNMAVWRVPATLETTWVSGAYVRWTMSRDFRANDLLRADEKVDITHNQRRVQGMLKLEGPSAPVLSKKSVVDGPSKGAPSKGVVFNRLGEGGKSVVDGPSKGAPSKGVVFNRLGEGGSSRALIVPKETAVFDRLGPRLRAVDRLGKAPVVCGLQSKGKQLQKPTLVRSTPMLQSKVVIPAAKGDSDDEDRDQNPKRKKKE